MGSDDVELAAKDGFTALQRRKPARGAGCGVVTIDIQARPAAAPGGTDEWTRVAHAAPR